MYERSRDIRRLRMWNWWSKTSVQFILAFKWNERHKRIYECKETFLPFLPLSVVVIISPEVRCCESSGRGRAFLMPLWQTLVSYTQDVTTMPQWMLVSYELPPFSWQDTFPLTLLLPYIQDINNSEDMSSFHWLKFISNVAKKY